RTFVSRHRKAVASCSNSPTGKAGVSAPAVRSPSKTASIWAQARPAKPNNSSSPARCETPKFKSTGCSSKSARRNASNSTGCAFAPLCYVSSSLFGDIDGSVHPAEEQQGPEGQSLGCPQGRERQETQAYQGIPRLS